MRYKECFREITGDHMELVYLAEREGLYASHLRVIRASLALSRSGPACASPRRPAQRSLPARAAGRTHAAQGYQRQAQREMIPYRPLKSPDLATDVAMLCNAKPVAIGLRI